MPRAEGQKAKLLVLLDLFQRRTDIDHKITVPQIVEYLQGQGIAAERKSIYNDIQALQAAGYDIEQQRGPGGGYYMSVRRFELPELKLLVDAVQASRFITERKSRQLIRKLESLASEYEARQMQRQVVVAGRVKASNEHIYYSVDALHEAISDDRQVSFLYSDWDMDKRRVPRRGGARYRVSPWALVWNSDNYYLIAYEEGSGIRHYRVDKMSRLHREDRLPRLGKEEFEHFDMAVYTRGLFGMYGGRMQKLHLRCKNRLVDAMLDRFGTDVTLTRQQEDRFELFTDAVISPQFVGWVCGFGGDVEVLEPPEARQQLAELAAALGRQYTEEDEDHAQ